MRKILSLILALCLGCVIVNADTYRARVSNATFNSANDYAKGCELSDYPSLLSATLDNNAKAWKQNVDNTSLPKLTESEQVDEIRFYGTEGILIRQDSDPKSNGGCSITIKVTNKIKNLRIYYTADGNGQRSINFMDTQTNTKVSTEYIGCGSYNGHTGGNNEYVHFEFVSRLSPGTYRLYSSGFTAGFVGLRFENLPDASYPSTDNLQSISDSKTWDLADVTGSITNNNANSSTYRTYAYYYRRYQLSYNADFDGSSLAFAGTYPIRNGSYAQDGILQFRTTTPGVVRVTFSETDNTPSTTAYRRYLAVNGTRTDYWVSRANTSSDGGYPEHYNEISGLIPVEAGNVYISGVKEDGTSSASIRVSKVEFFKTSDKDPGAGGNSLVGITDDTFSQRIYYYENGRSVSKWNFGGFKQTTHGLSGGIDDNGIIYYSSNLYDPLENPDSNDKNTNGNITFYAPSENEPNYWLSCAYGSYLYVPVNPGTSGTITITCTQDDYKNNGTGSDRFFELQKEGSSTVRKKLAMLKTSSIDFTADDISTFNDKSYLKLVGHYDKSIDYVNGYRYKGEMKVYTIAVAMNRNSNLDTDYVMDPPETDYDHGILGEHDHAVFNWTQGTVYTQGFHYGTLTMKNGAVLTGVNPDAVGASSGTETIHSYRNGDIVKYKTNYYGGLQLLSGEKTVYTITPPSGYYITTSVRIHGHYNKNAVDTDDGLGHTTYVSNFGGGKWESYTDNPDDDTYIRFPRDDDNARTTTLDFTVPASESVDFQVSGYQIFGVIDAVLVPKEAVPVIQQQLYYHYNDKINVDVTEHPRMHWGGTINYTPKNKDEELWWYYEPLGSKIASRGRWGYENSDPDHDPFVETDPGVKDQNITKKFSVRNYKFVNATGKFHSRTDNLEQDVYNVEDNYIPSSPSDISTLADGPSADGSVSLTIGQAGTYYFYIHDKNNNYNSPLGIVTFDNVTGVEDITVEDNDETDDLYAPVYNIYGQRVDSSYRGIVICNGRKYVRK